MTHWPQGCYDKNSCARHKECMYRRCRYEGKDIKNDIEYRLLVERTNQMRDDGTLPVRDPE